MFTSRMPSDWLENGVVSVKGEVSRKIVPGNTWPWEGGLITNIIKSVYAL